MCAKHANWLAYWIESDQLLLKLFFVSESTPFAKTCLSSYLHLSPVIRKPVFGVCDQVTLKPACSPTETSYSVEISDRETRGIVLSSQRITKMLIRLCRCTGWSASLLFAYGMTGFLMTWLIFIAITLALFQFISRWKIFTNHMIQALPWGWATVTWANNHGYLLMFAWCCSCIAMTLTEGFCLLAVRTSIRQYFVQNIRKTSLSGCEIIMDICLMI